MKIRFIAHASVLVDCEGQTILSDPWYEGKPFNYGWALLSPAAPVSFSDVSYIWISHEHPDHFSISTLKKIPATDKQRIKVLYQHHASPRITKAIKDLGFTNV